MKFLALLLGSLVFAASTNAQYFSAGWAPGKAVPTTTSTGFDPAGATQASNSKPGRPSLKELSSMFDLTNLLATGPVASLAARVGINITEKLAAAKSRKFWDDRVTLIDDDNYEDLIVNETMTKEEEKDRMWFVVITTTTSGQEGVSKYVDQVFDSAFNLTQEARDLPHVRWGRINYLNVTRLTTKWNVWSAPYIMVITDRGQTLRFWKASQLRLSDKIIRQFLLEEGWRSNPPWKTSYAPGGDREWIMDYFAIGMTAIYNNVTLLPNWLLYVMTGTLGSVLIGLLHRSPKVPVKVKRQPNPRVVISAPAAEPSVTTATASASSKATKRGGGKTKKDGKK
ncbi:hypothetical protein PILCRDRAFT_12851 [Piloderma croceum F 1598]|uniref:Thioredoxin-like fold domain-containing protein n=1 Tax=Piloderma croceum (strain F 1598) TaxID=765440 RepID=A0A0C3F8Z7_PILCF|nr:hypothetical protein PILCRDRAFT_12851 [Piloderma croceum F 1598]